MLYFRKHVFKLPSQVGVNKLVTELLVIIALITIIFYFVIKIKALRNSSKNAKQMLHVQELADKQAAFVAQITHDLKTPTTAQINTLHLLLTGSLGKLSPEQKEILEVSELSCRYMKDLISTILDAYRSDDGQLLINQENINISQLISDIHKENSTLLTSKGQTLKVTNTLSDNIVYADKLHLKRVIMNFLTNAITYSYNNSVIELQISSDDKDVTVNVINKSKMPPTEDLNNVFEKYKTLKNSKYNKTSTGLGLYLSKQIIKAHNGEIYAKLQPDNKCMFGFKIPVCAASKKA